jgi:RimJ/RimL family protein N-acetyltransferase
MSKEIQTARLRLINCDLPLIEAVLQGNAALAQATGLIVPDDWTEFGEPAFQFTKARLQDFPEDAPWWSYLPVIRAENRLVGSCGFVGRPNADGVVEIGYEIAASRRGLGFATEAAMALVQYAFSQAEVQAVMAHTLAEANPSTHVLQHCGMQKVADLTHPEDGNLWRWEVSRAHYSAFKSAKQ